MEQICLLDSTATSSIDPGTGIPTSNVINFESLLGSSLNNESNLMATRNLGCGGDGAGAGAAALPAGFEHSQLVRPGIEPIKSSTDDIAVHIPQNIKEQIWRGEYINLSILLKGAIELSEFSSGHILVLTANGQIESKPKVLKGRIACIEQWSDAFLILIQREICRLPEI